MLPGGRSVAAHARRYTFQVALVTDRQTAVIALPAGPWWEFFPPQLATVSIGSCPTLKAVPRAAFGAALNVCGTS